ncbi:hypothetical protein PENTCL1PPCAC_2429, partial [Pristionchus entomophagus]
SFPLSSSTFPLPFSLLLPPLTYPSPHSRMDLNRLPDELIQEIDSYLPFEDSLHLQTAYPRTKILNASLLSFYDSIQVCDDPKECFIIDSRGRKERRHFDESNFSTVATSLINLKEVTLMVKEANPFALPTSSLSSSTPFKEISVYSPGGFISCLVSKLGETLTQLSSITIHIDVSYETIKGQYLLCPNEDLRFALHNLMGSNCKVLIQISFGAMEYSDSDFSSRQWLLTGMEDTLKRHAPNGANVEFVVDAAQGYTDMTIEWGNLEYSFSFFYYNPSICDAVDGKDESMESEDEECHHPSTYPFHSLAPPTQS